MNEPEPEGQRCVGSIKPERAFGAYSHNVSGTGLSGKVFNIFFSDFFS